MNVTIQGSFPGGKPHSAVINFNRSAFISESAYNIFKKKLTLTLQPYSNRNEEVYSLDKSRLNLSDNGFPLPKEVLQKMQSVFQTDFNNVRVHTGGGQAESIGALAFATGNDIYFAQGQYNPHSSFGQRILGHELTHIVQQRQGRVKNPLGNGIAVVQNPGLEAEAERMGLRVSSIQDSHDHKQTLQRQVNLGAINQQANSLSSAGNFNFTAYSGKSVVQRFAVTLGNLSTASTIPVRDGGGRGLVIGSKIPHYSHAYRVNGTDLSYNLDKWVNNVNSDDDNIIGASDVTGNIRNWFGQGMRKKLRAIINAWDGTSTIFEPIVKKLVLNPEGNNGQHPYYDPRGEAATTSMSVQSYLSGANSLTIHLLTLRSTAHWRENTMKLLNVNSTAIQFGRPKTEENVVLDWADLLKRGRLAIKLKMQALEAPPADPPSEGQSSVKMDTILFQVFQHTNGFKRLYEKNILYQSHGSGYDIKHVGKNSVTDGKKANIFTAVNHARFILWVEWRAIFQLMKRGALA